MTSPDQAPEAVDPDLDSVDSDSVDSDLDSADPTAQAAAHAPARDAAAHAAAEQRPRSLALGLGLFLAGSLGTFFLMSLDVQVRFGPLWGTLGMLLASAGVLELCGLLRALPSDPRLSLLAPKPDEPWFMSPRVTFPLALAITVLGVLALGPGKLGLPLLLALLVMFLSSVRRPALFVFVAASLLLLPLLGEYGLWDPWETHYGEVAREILARDDWITLWWAQDEWFRSKPIFIFWIEALTWGALGIPFAPDSNPAHPEWAIRLPHYFLTMGALMASYGAMARIFGRRVAVLASLVLATTPYFFLLAHQAITDMPFVSSMTIALALFMIAVEEDPKHTARYFRLGPLMVSAQNVLLAAFVVVALPQALYLITRNLGFSTEGGGFWPHLDQFVFGSAGNPNIPGNPAHRVTDPYLRQLWFQPFAQAILWLSGLLALVLMLRKERRTAQLAMFGFYLFCSFAWMAKGIPGFALPGLIAAMYLFAAGRFSLLLSGRLRVGAGVLTIAVTGLPWYVAMYGRLGPFFTDRLLIHDHINRLASGVHGDTGSIQYFLWQLGYGGFPWIGLAPLGFAAWLYLTPSKDGDSPERRSAMLLALWFAAAFALFNAMITKFHHYIFPAVPPLSLLVGLVLDRAIGPRAEGKHERWGIVLAVLAPLLCVLGVSGLYGDVRGIVPEGVESSARAAWVGLHPWSSALCYALIAGGIVGLVAGLRLLGEHHPLSTRERTTSTMLGVGLFASAMTVAFAGRDLGWSLPERPFGQERLIHLFVYQYQRPFPDYIDYRPILTGFAVVAFVLLVVAAAVRLRKLALYAVLGTTFWFSAWALNVYLIDLTPHWSQRQLIKRYYEKRHGKQEPLIAWQMNWKGENVYTGNRVYTYLSLDNKEIEKWIASHPGTRAYFVLEHSRLSNFKRMLGMHKVEELSTERENNKFILVRADI